MRIVAAACSSLLLITSAASAQGPRPIERDLSYGADAAQRLDLWTPESKGFPTVVFVHGGSLTSGDKADSDYGRVCEAFPAAGVACANINYRLLPKNAWPASAEDLAAAIAWVRTNIVSRGGDPAKLFLLGHSSGAMLVALVGSDPRFLERHGLKPGALAGVMPMGSIMWDDDLEQAIAKNGRDAVAARFATSDPRGRAFGSLEAYEGQWPIRYVRAGLPPFMFLIAESEQVNPPVLKTNQKFVDDARALGVRAELTVFTGRTHYSNIRKIHEPGDSVFATVLRFVRQLH